MPFSARVPSKQCYRTPNQEPETCFFHRGTTALHSDSIISIATIGRRRALCLVTAESLCSLPRSLPRPDPRQYGEPAAKESTAAYEHHLGTRLLSKAAEALKERNCVRATTTVNQAGRRKDPG